MNLAALRATIDDGSAHIGVIGLGYVGLPVACLFAEAGFHVVGVDRKAERVADIGAGRSPIVGDEPGLGALLGAMVAAGRLAATTDYERLRDCHVVLVCVETPVDADHTPHYAALRAAIARLAAVLRDGALVVIESTVAPGTTERTVRPALETGTGRRAGQGFWLGHCPERVMPGRLLANLRSLSRVVGGASPETAATMIALYRKIVPAAELDATDILTAELVKTAENAYRDVNIAFANELALICESAGGDVWRVRELVNKSPGRNVLLPGAGVGGHCITKDPWLLAHAAGDRTPLRLIPAARAVNDAMPLHVVTLVEAGLAEIGKTLSVATVLVLGYAYLENSDDTRNSPSAVVVDLLEAGGAQVRIHDPFVPGYGGDFEGAAREADALVVLVAHDAYRGLDPAALNPGGKRRVLVDGRRVLDAEQARAAGWVYRRIGLAPG
jgi:UDP-N-acetyl-D-mannosaminuronic acid dehydrogenase